MNPTIRKVAGILTNDFAMNNFVELIREIFSTVKLVAPDSFHKEYSNFSSHVEGSYHVGMYDSPDGKKIAIFAVQLQRQSFVENSRSTQRSYAKKLIENGNCDAALIAYFTPGDPKWRLSFVRLDFEMKVENGKLKAAENITPAKRYSYLVGKDEPCHTAIERFHKFIADNNSEPTMEELEDAFSVEAVTNEFFELYCEKFYQLSDWLTKNEDFIAEADRCGFTVEQYAKKLLGQIVFLYFLQKKGWLGVGVWPQEVTEKEYNNIYYTSGAQGRIVKQYLPQIYVKQGDKYFLVTRALDQIPDEAEELIADHVPGERHWGSGSKTFLRTLYKYSQTHKKHFFDNYLEPLFYDTLNRNRGKLGYSCFLHCRIPFLSGGLFEPLDGYDWRSCNFDIPDELFSNKKSDEDLEGDGILDIFDRYNFTMSEDEPMEREVAIDPEMLGKVFENLLDEDHRRAKGAFYTPREVVHYMCQQCLINYLSENSDISVSAIKDFILYGDLYKDIDTEKTLKVTEANGRYHYEIDPNKAMKISPEIFSLKNGVNKLNVLDSLLSNIRVADPAVGSGAFPLGMLNEIVRARQNLTAYMAIGMNAFDTRLMYSIERAPYVLKYVTIKDCIFAADIEPSAVDIARLRLWLSLVIDDEINPNAQNAFEGHQNPSPLPNLECNIICGNSLIDEFEGNKLINNSLMIGTKGQLDFNSTRFEAILPKLLDAQDRLFKCDDPVKKEDIKDEISEIKNMLMHSQISLMSDDIRQKYYESEKRTSKPYVLWQIEFAKVFNEKGGFDVVIGNPPYLKEIDYKGVFDTVNKTSFGRKYGEGKMNFWYYFFHKGMDLLKPETGILSFIAPNYFVAGSGAKKLNDRLVNQCTIKTYVDFNKTKVFESADVQCMILIVENKKPDSSDSFKAYMFKQKVEHSDLPNAIQNLDGSRDIACYVVDNQREIMSEDYKINFENAKYSEVLKKIESLSSARKLFKATQGVVENPSFLNNKNIKALREKGYDVSSYSPGQGVFVIPKEELTDLGLNNEEKELLREYHEPNEIHRYVCDESFKNYLLYITRENVEDINKYPNIKKHLLPFRPFMEQRRETQKGTVKWFQLHWPRQEKLFFGEKIVYPQMGATPTFAYSNRPYFVNMSTNIVCAQENINMQVLTCILNSSLAHFWLLHRAKNRGVGLDIAVAVIDKFPVNETILSDRELSKLSKEVISMAEGNKDFSNLDELIDDRVFELYGISEEERSMIENYIDQRVNHG